MKSILLFKQYSEEYISAFNDNGFLCLFVEPLKFIFSNVDLLTEELTKSEYDGIILTSPRAIEAVSSAWSSDIKKKWLEKQVYVVGESSAKRVKSDLGVQSEGSESGNSLNLADYIIAKNYKPKKLLFPCGNLTTENIIQKLTAHNILISPLTVYETTENNMLLSELNKISESCEVNTLAGLVFFSPSGVIFVDRCIGKCKLNVSSIPKFAIGKTTANQMKDLNWNIDGVAEQPNVTSILDVIKTYFSSKS